MRQCGWPSPFTWPSRGPHRCRSSRISPSPCLWSGPCRPPGTGCYALTPPALGSADSARWYAHSTGSPAFASSRLRPVRGWRRWTGTAPRSGGRRPPRSPSAERTMIAKRVWRAGLSLALLAAFAFAMVAPPERCPSVSVAELRRSAQASVDWFVRNQNADGSWLYLYNADDDSISSEYNPVRHSGVTMGLYQAAAAGLPGALHSADQGTEWALGRLFERDGWAAVDSQGQIATGTTALLVAGLVIRREATGDTRYDDVLARLGRFLVAQTEPSGAVLASYDPVAGKPLVGEYSKYFTGEAYWALARLHRAFPRDVG